MRLFLVIVTLLLTASALAADTPATKPLDTNPQFEARSYKEADKSLHYRLLIPRGYDPSKGWPLVVWLHGSGENGNNNTTQLRPIVSTFLADKENAKFPAFILVPQCPNKMAWHATGLNKQPDLPDSSKLLIAAIKQLTNDYAIDQRRIYLGGFSMGGFGTWELLIRYPDLFAAAFPIAGVAYDRPDFAPLIKHIPIWEFQGDKDAFCPVEEARKTVAALKAVGGNIKYTELKDVGHECAKALADPELQQWLFAQKRATNASFTPAKLPDGATIILKTLADGTKGTWTGPVSATIHAVPRITIDGTRYRLKPAAGSPPEAAATLEKIGKGELKDPCKITGAVELTDYAWITVDKIEPTQ